MKLGIEERRGQGRRLTWIIEREEWKKRGKRELASQRQRVE